MVVSLPEAERWCTYCDSCATSDRCQENDDDASSDSPSSLDSLRDAFRAAHRSDQSNGGASSRARQLPCWFGSISITVLPSTTEEVSSRHGMGHR